jgi:cysteine desulfurase/selenocysteine lyase
MITDYRKEFAHIDEGFVHLNHAGVSGMSRRTTDRIAEFSHRQAHDPLGCFPWAFEQMKECRERFARLMGASTENLAFTKNTAHGISIIADGFDWKSGDEVVFADCEYPANSYPWLAQQDRGVVCKVLKTRTDGTLRAEDYEAAMTERTRIIAVSWVQFTTGFRVDLAALTQLAHSKGALIVVDIIQALGALPLDVTALGIDFAATGSQKWLIGPLGVGGLYATPQALSHLRLVNMGAGSVNNAFEFDTLKFDVKPTVQRYEEGTPNIFGYAGLNAALEILEEVGQPAIADAIQNVTRYAMNGLRSHGYLVDSPDTDSDRAGIVMFHHPEHTCEAVSQALIAAKINVAVRGGRVRFAPHFYNTEDDIDRALDALL